MKDRQTLFTDALGLKVMHDKSLLVGLYQLTAANCYCSSLSKTWLSTCRGNQAYLCTETVRIQLPQETRHRKVQGFAVGPVCVTQDSHKVLLYTDNEFSIFNYNASQHDAPFELLYEGETKDWINAALFLQNAQHNHFVLHMAHSTMLHVQCQSAADAKFSGLDIVELASCTDYSMLYHTHLHGNHYDELVVMSGNGFGELLIWHPRGALHSIEAVHSKKYPLLLRLEAHNGVIFSIDFNVVANLLVTTSDDRSVKFWQVESAENANNWQLAKVKPMFSCFGHGARVMCAIVVQYDAQIYVISGGEDSHICIWDCLGNLLLKRRQQFGAPVWRLAYDAATATLYSSGATGNVLACSLQRLLSQQQSQLMPLPALSETDEFIAKVKFLTRNTIVGLSSKNALFYMQLNESAWHKVDSFSGYKCTVLAVHNNLIACCGYRRVTLLSFDECQTRFEQLYDGEQLAGVIRAFHFLGDELYLISDELGNCLLLRGQQLHIESRLKLPSCREPWLTAALLVTPHCLLLSNRQGHMLLYARDAAEANFELQSTLKRLHGSMGATLLQLVKLSNREAYVLSAGHEAALKMLHLSWSPYKLSMRRRECVPLAWVEAAPTTDLLLGFNDNHFVAWSRQHDVLLQLPCGGGHRCWHYWLDNDVLHVVFVKLKQVLHYQQTLLNSGSSSQLALPPRNLWHTRSCNTMQLLQRHKAAAPVLVSGGDDNLIKISTLVDEQLQQLAELHTHISSVRHLTVQPQNDDESWLIFSVGGRAQLCINRLDIKDAAPNACCVQELCTHTVRTVDAQTDGLLEARLMAVEALRQAAIGDFAVYVASADGKIRLHSWQLSQPAQLHLLQLIDLQRCPLQLRCLAAPALLLLAASTNGELHVYDSALCTKRLQLQLHAAGINALDALIDEQQQQLHVLSGGDDQLVRHTVFSLLDMSVQHSASYKELHDAQVNALTLHASAMDERELNAYSCGIDKQLQRLKLSSGQHRSLGSTCVADIKGMLLDANQRVYFYGCGLQIMPLEQI